MINSDPPRPTPIQTLIIGSGPLAQALAVSIVQVPSARPLALLTSARRFQTLFAQQGLRLCVRDTNSSKTSETNVPINQNPHAENPFIGWVEHFDDANLTFGATIIHAATEQHVLELAKQDGFIQKSWHLGLRHVVCQNGLTAERLLKNALHGEQGRFDLTHAQPRVMQWVMACTFQIERSVPQSAIPCLPGSIAAVETVCASAGDQSRIDAIEVSQDFQPVFQAWLDRQSNPVSPVKMAFSGLIAKFAKVAVNAATNPLMVLFNLENLSAYAVKYHQNTAFAALVHGVLTESYRMAIKQGAYPQNAEDLLPNQRFSGKTPSVLREWLQRLLEVTKQSGHHPTSTRMQFEAGRETDIPSINGGLVALAKDPQDEVPLNYLINCYFKEAMTYRKTIHQTNYSLKEDNNFEQYMVNKRTILDNEAAKATCNDPWIQGLNDVGRC